MKFAHKAMAVLLAGIVCFSFSTFTSHATQTTEDATEAESETTDASSLPIESNEISGWPQGPVVSAESAILMDAATGTILYSKNIDAREYPASITKLMTVLLALENSSLDETVVFSQNAVFSIERASSHIARTTDEELTMEQCLYAIMLESANECANAVAEHIAGSVEAFADMMNQRAAELGCTNTHFVNPHGLHDPDHYTTAHDMALITREVLTYDAFREISGTVNYNLPPTNKNDGTLTMYNHHSMICTNRTSQYYDATVFAGKTGYTTDALNTLVTCASRNGMELICVLMRSPSGTPYPDTASLLDYGTEHFHPEALPERISELPQDVRQAIANAAPGYDLDTAEALPSEANCVVLPDSVPFEALTPSVSVRESEDSSVLISVTYHYETVSLGTAVYRAEPIQVQSAAVTGTDSLSEDDSRTSATRKPGSQQNILKYILIGAIAVILLLLITLLTLFAVQTHQANTRRRKRRASQIKRNRRSSGSRGTRRTASRRLEHFDDPDLPEEFDDFNF